MVIITLNPAFQISGGSQSLPDAVFKAPTQLLAVGNKVGLLFAGQLLGRQGCYLLHGLRGIYSKRQIALSPQN
jgi:hypothetical protein